MQRKAASSSQENQQINDRYEMLQNTYEEAEEKPIAGFIFNPLPIQEEWEEYNR